MVLKGMETRLPALMSYADYESQLQGELRGALLADQGVRDRLSSPATPGAMLPLLRQQATTTATNIVAAKDRIAFAAETKAHYARYSNDPRLT